MVQEPSLQPLQRQLGTSSLLISKSTVVLGAVWEDLEGGSGTLILGRKDSTHLALYSDYYPTSTANRSHEYIIVLGLMGPLWLN